MTDLPRPSRRALVAGAAWSVPVITMAAAAPAVAMSQTSGDLPPGVDVLDGHTNGTFSTTTATDAVLRFRRVNTSGAGQAGTYVFTVYPAQPGTSTLSNVAPSTTDSTADYSVFRPGPPQTEPTLATGQTQTARLFDGVRPTQVLLSYIVGSTSKTIALTIT
jgi:hypothetical protein